MKDKMKSSKPFAFSEEGRESLWKWLDDKSIGALKDKIRETLNQRAYYLSVPGQRGEESKRLRNVSVKAGKLKDALASLHPNTLRVLTWRMPSFQTFKEMLGEIEQVSMARAIELVPSGRRDNIWDGVLTSRIADVVREAGIKVSGGTGSKFTKILNISFQEISPFIDVHWGDSKGHDEAKKFVDKTRE